MSRPLSIRTASLVTIAALGLILSIKALDAPAKAPRSYQVTSVQMLANQLQSDTSSLMRTLDHKYRVTWRQGGDDALLRLRDLNEAAAALSRSVRLYANNPIHTEDDFRNLREAYLRLQPALGALPDVGEVRATVRSIGETMTQLTGYYAPAPTEAIADWKVRQNVADLARLSSRMANGARGLELRGQVNQAAWERIDQVNAAAQRLYGMVGEGVPLESHDLADAYADLVTALQGARDVIGDFNLNYQTRLSELWILAARLKFLAPRAELGQYDIHDFHR